MVTKIMQTYLCDICNTKYDDLETANFCEEEGTVSYPKDIIHIPFRIKESPKEYFIVLEKNSDLTREISDHYSYHSALTFSPNFFDNSHYTKNSGTFNLFNLTFTLETLNKNETKKFQKIIKEYNIELPELYHFKKRKEMRSLVNSFSLLSARINATLEFAKENGLTNLEKIYQEKQINSILKYNN